MHDGTDDTSPFLSRFSRAMLAKALAAVCAAMSLGAIAQVLIDPVVIELAARQRSAPLTLTLSAKATAPLVLQTEVLKWTQGIDGRADYVPSDDLVVVPPIVELRPGESQLVRVAFRGVREGTAEQAYRLRIEDTGAGATPGQGVSFRMRYDLPVMLGPTVPARPAGQALQWSLCDGGDASICVRLNNNGARRVTLRKLALEGAGWTQAVEQPGTVLAQGVREWRLPKPAGASGAPLALSGETSQSETVAARFASP